MNEIKACIFDAYGTLFDVNSACRELSKEVGDKWEKLASLWRLRQVEYTWLRNSMDEYIDFWQITTDALDYAMETLEIENNNLKDELLNLYLKLDAYPEVKDLLKKLKQMGLKTGILSNGSMKMLNRAVDNANIRAFLDKILSVEECKIYKPSKIVYDLVENKMLVKRENVLFFSSNAWDMHAASNYGFKSIWVNRNSDYLEKLPGKPEMIIQDLTQILKTNNIIHLKK